MSRRNINLTYKWLTLFVGALVWTLCLGNSAIAQGRGVLEAGSTITVRTNELIDVDYNTRQTFSGTVTQNVMSRNGSIAVPRGSEVELVVSNASGNLALGLSGIMVNGEHFNVSAGDPVVNSGRRQVTTRGGGVYVPAGSVLTFRLERPLRMGMADDTRRYKPGYEDESSPAYRAGMAAGRADAARNLARDTRTSRWTAMQDRREYEAGYNRAYDEFLNQNQAPATSSASINIGPNRTVTWQAPATARVYVQVDNKPEQLFAEGITGSQVASWIERGHVYLFMLRDMNGNEIARERLDTRR